MQQDRCSNGCWPHYTAGENHCKAPRQSDTTWRLSHTDGAAPRHVDASTCVHHIIHTPLVQNPSIKNFSRLICGSELPKPSTRLCSETSLVDSVSYDLQHLLGRPPKARRHAMRPCILHGVSHIIVSKGSGCNNGALPYMSQDP
jgi:hypothetical protein